MSVRAAANISGKAANGIVTAACHTQSYRPTAEASTVPNRTTPRGSASVPSLRRLAIRHQAKCNVNRCVYKNVLPGKMPRVCSRSAMYSAMARGRTNANVNFTAKVKSAAFLKRADAVTAEINWSTEYTKLPRFDHYLGVLAVNEDEAVAGGYIIFPLKLKDFLAIVL